MPSDETGLLCETLCRQSGWLGELVVMLLIAARALYLGWRNRQLAAQAVSLQAKVETLSMRPPPPVTLQLAPHPALASLVPIAVSTAPADPSSTEKNAVFAGEGAPVAGEPPDPDHVEPPKDGP